MCSPPIFSNKPTSAVNDGVKKKSYRFLCFLVKNFLTKCLLKKNSPVLRNPFIYNCLLELGCQLSALCLAEFWWFNSSMPLIWGYIDRCKEQVASHIAILHSAVSHIPEKRFVSKIILPLNCFPFCGLTSPEAEESLCILGKMEKGKDSWFAE